MTQEYIEVIADNGRLIPFAVEAYDGPIQASRIQEGIRKRVAQTLDGGMSAVKTIAEAITKNVGSLDDPPDRISAEVGLTVTADATFAIASSSAQAHIVIKLDWDNTPSRENPAQPENLSPERK